MAQALINTAARNLRYKVNMDQTPSMYKSKLIGKHTASTKAMAACANRQDPVESVQLSPPSAIWPR